MAIPMIAYENGLAAMDWLARAFGFKETLRMLGEGGKLAQGAMDTGDGEVMVAQPSPAYESPRRHRESCAAARRWLDVPYIIDGVLVHVDNVDLHYARAVAAGALILSEIEYGGPGRRYRVEDCEGHRWMFLQRKF
jgi:PhnB protein